MGLREESADQLKGVIMKIWIISDTHFNHKNIIQYENRPFNSIDEMNDAMIKRWNSVVSPDDIVYHLGDVGLGNESSLKWIIPSLNGHKILVRGNHDQKSKNFYIDCGFEEVRPSFIEEHEGVKIFFSHRPDTRPGNQHDTYDMHFYGHVHAKEYHGAFPTIARNGACLCVERWDYTPVELNKVIEMCKNSGIHSDSI